MPQNEHARPHSGEIHGKYQNGLRVWLENTSKSSFSEDELKLHRSAALAYADPRRPSIRSLYTMLCMMLARDGSLTGVFLKHPSPESFRRLVLTLPTDFVDHMRYGREISVWDIVRDAGDIIDNIKPSPAPAVRKQGE
ncbi:hypothetical protein [Ensifer sp. SSB1]|jgi:hypothetical protein|uniref:hypothetical protein n=1 Tax=Ensifer sp. SSB1 TaxID=2795385 RepID=UPI001A635690|nr:hypothetical protein [Ensifer sp. SSB1]MBK5571604.1 hypothetical protein [Ensifer sp. SSB1]